MTATNRPTIPDVPSGFDLAREERATWATLTAEYAFSTEELDALAAALQLRSQSRDLLAQGAKSGDTKLTNCGLTAARSAISALHLLFAPMRKTLARAKDTERPRMSRGGQPGALRDGDGGPTLAMR